MTLNLGAIRYTCNPTKTKKNPGLFSGSTVVNRSPEEIFMKTQMAPACHSHHITNEYFLNVNVKFDGCTCCETLPSISIPLTVIPLTHMASYGFLEPEGYSPTQLGYFKF